MKITIAQLNFHIGNFESNTKKIIEAIDKAKNDESDIICFSELATCGYPPRDFLEFEDFIQKNDEAIAEIAKHTVGIAVVLGAPQRNPVIEGKDLFNAAYFIADGEIQYVYHKSLLPTYDVFDEYRYFEPGNTFDIVEYKGKKIALTVCEDIWNVGNKNPLYIQSPMEEISKHKPDFVLNLSASPFSTTHHLSRRHILKTNVELYNIPMFYVNHVGAQTELIFDGGSYVINAKGTIVAELPFFEESIQTFELENLNTLPSAIKEHKEIELIDKALTLGLKDYHQKLGFKKAILGLSGGIDSAVVAAIAAQALGAKNVYCILMPSQFSSDHSVNDARALAQHLGCPYEIIPIQKMYDAAMGSLETQFWGQPFGLAEENLQARIRGLTLMALSNKFGNILLNTSNKSEAAVGYGTLYGDMCGGLSVIGDLYKNKVYELARYINRNEEIIPNNIINKAPSAELRPNQLDSDSLPDYDILDAILELYIEKRKGPKAIIAAGYDEKLVHRVLRMVNINEFKRFQTAPTLRITNKSFGMGRRMPIVGKYLS